MNMDMRIHFTFIHLFSYASLFNKYFLHLLNSSHNNSSTNSYSRRRSKCFSTSLFCAYGLALDSADAGLLPYNYYKLYIYRFLCIVALSSKIQVDMCLSVCFSILAFFPWQFTSPSFTFYSFYLVIFLSFLQLLVLFKQKHFHIFISFKQCVCNNFHFLSTAIVIHLFRLVLHRVEFIGENMFSVFIATLGKVFEWDATNWEHANATLQTTTTTKNQVEEEEEEKWNDILQSRT